MKIFGSNTFLDYKVSLFSVKAIVLTNSDKTYVFVALEQEGV